MQKLLTPLNNPHKKLTPCQLNPQFNGIGKKLNKSHLEKKQAQKQRKETINRLSYLRKQQQLAGKKVVKKQKQLQKLMNVIARKQIDSIEKQQRRRAKEQALAYQRQMNLRRKSQHQQRLRNAFLSLYDQHQTSANKMQQTSRRYNQMMQSHKKSSMRQKHERVFRISKEKQEGRQKIKGYLKERADLFTSRYKQKIQQQQDQLKKINQQKQELSEQQGQVTLRLQSSISQLQALNDEIIKATLDSRIIPGNNSWNWSALTKNYNTIDTKEESINNTQSKIDKMIEKELSINESDFSKV